MNDFIPIIFSLSDFLSQNFPHFSWYPHWYLGNPYYYLIGPVLPLLTTLLTKLLSLDFQRAYFAVLFLGFFWGSYGFYLLLKEFKVGRRESFLAIGFYLFLPAFLVFFQYQNGLSLLSLSFFPYALISYKRFLQEEKKASVFFLAIQTAFLLLIDLSVLLSLIVGFTALFFAGGIKEGKEEKIAKTILIFLLAAAIASFWYTPYYWWVILTNPSVGGFPLSNLIASLFKTSLSLVPIVLALFVVKWRHFRPKGILLFAYLYFVSFFILTVVRFLADYDFVMDWTSFAIQLQFALSIILAYRTEKLMRKTSQKGFALFIGVISLSIIVSVLAFLRGNNSIDSNYRLNLASLLQKNIKPHERVFLSGSSVFWINSLLPDLWQVRGGADQASIHPFWAHAAYQIREGESGLLAYDWLRILGASYILVHEKDSSEPYHDFKRPEKFPRNASLFKMVSDFSGDKLYRIKNSSIMRLADSKILKAAKPENGADSKAIHAYSSYLKQGISFNYTQKDGFFWRAKTNKNEVVSLAVTYSPLWRLTEGGGFVASDSFGNLVVVPKNSLSGRYRLEYGRIPTDFLFSLGFLLAMCFVIFDFDKVYPKIKKKLPNLSVGLSEDDY